MAETLRDLVVSLSLQTDNFTRNIKSVNKQIAEAESQFKLAASGVEGFERSATGLATQLSTLERRLSLQKDAVTQYERALSAANDKLQECFSRQNDYAQRLTDAKTAQQALKEQVAAAAQQVRTYSATLGENDSATIAAKANLDALKAEYHNSCAEVKKLTGQNIGGAYLGNGTVIGGGPLYCRKQPIAGYESWGQFQEGTTIQIYTCSTSGWYETRWPVGGSNVGYVMANYVSTSGGGSSGGSTVTFNPSAAVAYAKGHSETTENALCSNRNTSFGSSTNNDCANFVSQCLVAGGLPMFDGWCYKVSGIPSSWNTGGWTWTYSGYQALNRKGRVSAVALSNVKPGDFIYNYDSSQPAGKQYTHAMLAVSTYKNGGVDICGHTRNQNTVFKSFNSSNCKCYRVNPTITIGPDEKRVTLPATGSGATVH